MSDSESAVPSSQPAPGRRRRAVIALGVTTVAILALATWRVHRDSAPSPPVVDLVGADPRLVQAVADARATVLREPRRAGPWGHLGMVLFQHRFLAEARQCFTQAERYDPRDVRWPYLAAQIDRMDDGPRAIAALTRASVMDPDNALVHLQLAELLFADGQFDEAAAQFQRLLDGPHQETPLADVRAELGLARCALQRDRLTDALYLAQSAAQALPTLKATHIVLAEIHLRSGDPKAAKGEQKKILTLTDTKWPDPYLEGVEMLSVDVHARLDLGRRFLAQGRVAEGLAWLEETAHANPRSAPAWITLGRAYLRVSRWQGAQQAFERALTVNANDAVALADVAYALSRQGEWSRAAVYYAKAIDRNPHAAENYYHVSDCRLHQGNVAEAITALRTAVRLRPNFAVAWRELGQILGQHGDRYEALDCLRQAIALAPEDEVARKQLAALR